MNIGYKREFTPENLSKLKCNEVFVFGSNRSGFHVGGAAKIAVNKFGAIYGKSCGLQGQSYAIPTFPCTLEEIKSEVNAFLDFARKDGANLIFYVSPIGCGNAGFTPYEIAPLFIEAVDIKNILLPKEFVNVLQIHPRFTGVPRMTWDSNYDFLDKYKLLKKEFSCGNEEAYEEITKLRIKTFQNTILISNLGFYYTEDNNRVELGKCSFLTDGTKYYSNEFSVSNVSTLSTETEISIIERDCLNYALELQNNGYYPAVLNMASNVKPGGGVLKGSAAQEESIFRRTNLFQSLYQFTSFGGQFGVKIKPEQYPMNDDFGGIYSPGVTVFRESEKKGYKLMGIPQTMSFISVAAVKRPKLIRDEVNGETLHIDSSHIGTIKNKIRTILRIGLRHRHDSLVLGAWGCGAYANPASHIANLFHEVIEEAEFKNKYRKIVFAIMEDHNSRKSHNPEGNLIPFQREFCDGEYASSKLGSLFSKLSKKFKMNDIYNLKRFVDAQEGIYPIALRELQEGRKRSHWMWFVFPQLMHLGHSYNSKFYGISGTEEAAAYLENHILGQRLREVCEVILDLSTNDAEEVFGGIDSRKLRSSMTLFDIVSPNDVFARVLDKYFNGKGDQRTRGLLF